MLLLKSSLEAVKAWMTVSAAEEERCSKERCFSDGFDVCLGGGSRWFSGQAGDSDHKCRGSSYV